jgi:hypothetical protein
MNMIQVPRAKLCELAGVPESCSDAQLDAAMDAALSRQQAAVTASAAERHLTNEDKRLVAAAINDGRLPVARQQFWVSALAADRAQNRSLLASLAPGAAPGQRVVVDPALEGTHKAVLARLGVAPDAPPETRPVAAAAAPRPNPDRVVRDSMGFEIPDIPQPVLLQRGTPASELTQSQLGDAMLRSLGPRFAAGAREPAPKKDFWYQPSPHAPSTPIVGADGVVTGWQAKPDNDIRSI